MQFGRALWRILTNLHKADPRLGPVFLSKVDIADGFYWIQVNANDVPKLGVVVPTEPGQPQLFGSPLVLPMGWMQSPPMFTAATETVADLTNQALLASTPAGPHRLDVVSESDGPVPALAPNSPPLLPAVPLPTKSMPRGRPRPPVKSWDVYVDDFLGMVQRNWQHRRHGKRVLLHTLDKVFRPPDLQDNPHRQEPASVKKMRKGDATWTTRKVILGWIIDTVRLTIELPARRIARLFELLDSVPAHQRRVSTKKWQQLVGEIRSMVLAVPGGRGLFSALHQVLKVRTEDGTRARLSMEVHAILQDFRSLARDLKNRPTRIAELIPANTPATIGAQDAAGTGMGGVHFVPLPDGTIAPLLWRSPFPPAVQTCLVSYANPDGTITNSDLELAASVAQHEILVTQVYAREATIHNFSDNTAKSTPSTPLASYYLTNRRTAVKPKDVTDTLRHAMQINVHHTGIQATDISARSLRAGGAMAMFFGKIDMNNIRLMGRWYSDAMMRYLHGQAQPIVGRFAEVMYNNRAYTFQPDETVLIIDSYND
jgi:hypothetical protein